jgi:hypothetical protein
VTAEKTVWMEGGNELDLGEGGKKEKKKKKKKIRRKG